jgi:23S rRNA pseudouridine1911/1915/1917 synthase
MRLDHFLLHRFPEFTRSRLQSWIKAGLVLVNGRAEKASSLLRGGETVEFTPGDPPLLHAEAEDILLDILYEDEAVVAVNKPAGMVVHAGAGTHSGTLVNALLHRFQQLSAMAGELRPGIVHRLDRYTSGVLLVARNDAAHQHLARQFSSREVEKTYVELVEGHLKKPSGRIAAPIARDPVRRTRMTARLATGRAALTNYELIQRFGNFTLLKVRIATGRTHQIRAHMASIGHPVAGDKLYGASAADYGRYFLHAWRIAFTSPASGQRITITAPLPPELLSWLGKLPGGDTIPAWLSPGNGSTNL